VNALSSAQLRVIEVDARVGRPVALEDVEQMSDVLDTLLDEAAAAGEPHDDLDDLVGTIERLEKSRQEAVSDLEEKERETDKRIEWMQSEHAQALADLANTAAEYKARAEKAESDLSQTVRHGHGLDAMASTRVDAIAITLADVRLDLETMTERWGEATKAKATASADREAALRDYARLKHALDAIVRGRPEDAHRQARIAIGHDVLEKSGTHAREGYVPTRAERRKTKR
jgi:chromosome segregation ATPase